MGGTAKKHATYHDILALPEHLVGQIIDGELIVQPRPTGEHGHEQGELFTDLNSSFGRVAVVRAGGRSCPSTSRGALANRPVLPH